MLDVDLLSRYMVLLNQCCTSADKWLLPNLLVASVSHTLGHHEVFPVRSCMVKEKKLNTAVSESKEMGISNF